jgi:hypothetical protein
MAEEETEYIYKLENALEKKKYNSLLNLNNAKISQIKNDILQKMHFKPSIIKKFIKSLKDYRFVDDLQDIHYGSYIRWINMNKLDDLKLTNGGIICDIKMTDTGAMITIKNNINRFFNVKIDENLIFQKLNNEEKIILYALDEVN